jgi:uncharacterized protein (DUF2249 family)
MEASSKLIITPKTKVLQLIEAYPQLEDVLIGFVPAFKKLKKPLLRNTVARITTLQQAASVGNVNVGELINRLRKEVGQEIITATTDTNYNTKKPAWFDEKRVKQELDVRPMLAAGEHPVAQVMADLNVLPEGHIYKLIAPFLPAPLIDKAMSLGAEHWIVKESEQLFIIYFFRK